MSTFHTTTLDRPIIDTLKRVRYSAGLVLGVDEFEQEQAYFMARDRLHQRALHGYGTVNGLDVSLRDAAGSPEIVVAPGLAVDPHGRSICVPAAQCAKINEWLDRNRERIDGELASPPDSLEVHVLLCFRECKTDEVPVPGGPCRSDEETRTASRIRDHFELHLSTKRPPQAEEMGVQRLGRLLRRVRVSAVEPAATLEALLEALQNDSAAASPPDDAPIYLHPDSAPEILAALQRTWVTRLRTDYLRPEECGSAAEGDDCVLLATLRFDIQEIGGRLQVVAGGDGDVEIDEDERPFLLTTRVLQEWLSALYGGREFKTALDTFATLFLLDGHTIRAWVHHPGELTLSEESVTVEVDEEVLGRPTAIDRPITGANVFDLQLADSPPIDLSHAGRVTVRFDAARIETAGSPPESLLDLLDGSHRGYIDRRDDELLAYLFADGEATLFALADLVDVDPADPSDGDILVWEAESERWVSRAAEAAVSSHGDLSGLDEDDHEQYLRTDGRRPLGGNLSAGGNLVRELGEAQRNGDAVRFEQAIKRDDDAGGDLRGRYPTPVVRRLQTRNVSDAAPSPNDALVWTGDQWAPRRIAGGESGFERGLTRIVAGNWRHGQTTTLRVLLVQDRRERLVPGIVVAFGKEEFGDGGSVLVGEGSLDANSFRVYIEEDQLGQLPFMWFPMYIRPTEILPVQVHDMQPDQWTVEAQPPSDEPVPADAALFILPTEVVEWVFNRSIQIQVLGDFVLDETREAVIDARHLFGRFPSGRPDRGLPGGVFRSWTRPSLRLRNLNAITREELREVPGVGPQIADRIIRERDAQGRFDAIEDLARLPGINRRLLDELQFHLRTGEGQGPPIR
jgi:hypothetical protein